MQQLRITLIILLISSSLALSACGQKGPLYIEKSDDDQANSASGLTEETSSEEDTEKKTKTETEDSTATE